MIVLFVAIFVILGLAVGSFVNVVIVRVPSDESIVAPASKCPLCGTPIEPRDNIPVISWLLLRGKCRHCGEPIHWGYPVVELLNAVLWGLAAFRFGPRPNQSFTNHMAILVPFLLLFSCLLALSAIDIQIYRLPNKITLPARIVSIPLLFISSLIIGEWRAIIPALIGAVFYYAFIWIPAYLYPKGMGLGDAKLAFLMGLYLGWLGGLVKPDTFDNGWARLVLGGVTLPLFSLIIACFIGIIVGAGAFIVRKGKSQPYPFGPWLALGCVIAVLFSHQLVGHL